MVDDELFSSDFEDNSVPDRMQVRLQNTQYGGRNIDGQASSTKRTNRGHPNATHSSIGIIHGSTYDLAIESSNIFSPHNLRSPQTNMGQRDKKRAGEVIRNKTRVSPKGISTIESKTRSILNALTVNEESLFSPSLDDNIAMI